MGGPGGGLRSASAQCGVVKRDVTNCLKERAEAALNCFCTTGDTLAAWPHPPGLPAFHQAGRGGGECWPSTNPASLALNPYIPWLPTLLVAQLGTSHLQTKCLMSPEPVPPITGTTLLLTPRGTTLACKSPPSSSITASSPSSQEPEILVQGV